MATSSSIRLAAWNTVEGVPAGLTGAGNALWLSVKLLSKTTFSARAGHLNRRREGALTEFGKLTYTEIKEAAQSNWIVLIPTGCTEQQGTHLPVDFDTWFVGNLCNSASSLAAERFSVNSLVLPTMPFGPTPEHLGFGAGYINIPQNVHESVFRDILASITEQGFRRIIVWQGCGQHQLAPMAERFVNDMSSDVNVFFPEMPYQRIWEDLVGPSILGGHADGFATSISLYLRPEGVRKDQIHDTDFTMPNWSNPNLDLSRHTKTGSIGDLSVASAELGKELWESLVEACSEIIYEYDQLTSRPDSR